MGKGNRKKLIETILMAIIFIVISIVCYKQSVSMKITEKIGYEEAGNVGYKVYLTDKTYYNREYLEEGMQYITSIIDYVDVDFNYLVRYDDKIKYNINTNTVADIKIVDKEDNDKIIYETTEVLKPNKTIEKEDNYLNVSENIKVDYKKYNKLANDFKTNYGISADCKLIVKLQVEYTGSYKSIENINNNKILSLEIPLSQQMITINKTENIVNTSTFTNQTNNTIINKILLVISIFFIVITIITIIRIIKIKNQLQKEETLYEKTLRKYLRQYDAYITETTEENVDIKNKTIIKVSTFKELIDVRNNIEKAIIYNKVNEKKSRFMIIEEETVYVYEMKEEDYRK